MTKRFGFTLAEVLITLGIIGVVAAMTMPTLMNSTNGAQYKTAYKKALSVLSQAVVLNVALDDYDMSQTSVSNDTDTSKTSLYALFNNRMNVVKTNDGTGNATNWSISGNGLTANSDIKMGPGSSNYTLYFNDGITFSFKKTDTGCTEGTADGTTTATNKCYGVIDVNGEKNPNKVVNCDGKTWKGGDDTCKVSNPTDVYPVVMYDQTILPATRAAEAVLYGAGK